MKLADAFALRRKMETKGQFRYSVWRGRRSPGISPFYVRKDGPR